MTGDFRIVTTKAKIRKGTFTDVATGTVVPLYWAGHWGVSGGSLEGEKKGVLIPLKQLPKVDIEIGKVYRVKFDYVDKTNDHHVDEFVVLEGIDGIEDPLNKRRHQFVKFKSVSNFDVLKEVKL